MQINGFLSKRKVMKKKSMKVYSKNHESDLSPGSKGLGPTVP